MSGWIRLHRGWRDCDVFTGEPASEREAWVHLIEIAAWKPMLRRAGKGDVINVGRGQLHTAERTLADMWFWDRKRVKRFLNRLEKYGMIKQESGPSGSLITICNYCSYQGDGTDDGTIHGANQGPSEDHSRTTQEEGKQGKEGKEGKKKKFVLPEWVDAEAWADWEQFRIELKEPMTDTARALNVGKLKKAREMGYSDRDIIDKSISAGWRGLFEPKGEKKAGRPDLNGMSVKDKVNELVYAIAINRDAATLRPKEERGPYREKYLSMKAEVDALRAAYPNALNWSRIDY